MSKKLLILDGIGGATLGRDLHLAVLDAGVKAIHRDLATLDRRPFYKPRAALAKAWSKKAHGDNFYHLPRSDKDTLRPIFEEVEPDVVLVIGFCYKFISPTELKSLADEFSSNLYLYDTDSCNLYSRRREFIFFIDNELPVYDEVFSFSEVVTGFFNRLGIRASFAPFGALPVPQSRPREACRDVLFVGSADLRRVFLLENINERVEVFGNRWQRNYPLMSEALKQRVSDESVWGEQLQQLLVSSKIVLNITRSPFYGAETGINLRIFEALAAGCFVLTDYCDEVVDLFEAGREIETFKGAAELVEKVAYYLENEKERQAIARRGHDKFLQSYTWQVRSRDMLEKMGLS
ncbi:MAG: hypothetical protein Kow0083_02170 [Methylophaga sp.]